MKNNKYATISAVTMLTSGMCCSLNAMDAAIEPVKIEFYDKTYLITPQKKDTYQQRIIDCPKTDKIKSEVDEMYVSSTDLPNQYTEKLKGFVLNRRIADKDNQKHALIVDLNISDFNIGKNKREEEAAKIQREKDVQEEKKMKENEHLYKETMDKNARLEQMIVDNKQKIIEFENSINSKSEKIIEIQNNQQSTAGDTTTLDNLLEVIMNELELEKLAREKAETYLHKLLDEKLLFQKKLGELEIITAGRYNKQDLAQKLFTEDNNGENTSDGEEEFDNLLADVANYSINDTANHK